jgi:1,4-dihydroxy-2-naphthoyl-CoA hydrolase
MKIWSETPPTLEEISRFSVPTIHSALGIRITALGDDFIEGSMPVDERTHQPAGFLHGGASVVLAESLGSMASMFVLGRKAMEGGAQCFGIEVNASHVKAMRSGTVTGRARPIQLGAKLHLWDIRLTDEAGDLISICRLTVFVRAPRT